MTCIFFLNFIINCRTFITGKIESEFAYGYRWNVSICSVIMQYFLGNYQGNELEMSSK